MKAPKPIFWFLAAFLALVGSVYKFQDQRHAWDLSVSKHVETGLNRYAETLALLARSQSVHDWSAHSFVDVESLFNQVVLREKALQEVYLLDSSGKMIARNTHNSGGLYLNDVDRREPAKSSQPKQVFGKFGALQVVRVGESSLQLHKEIFVHDKLLGSIVAHVDLLPLAAEAFPGVISPFRRLSINLEELAGGPEAFNGLSQALQYQLETKVFIRGIGVAILTVLVAVAILFVLALVVSTLLVNPVRSLMRSIQNVSAGRYEQIDLAAQYGPMKWLLLLYNSQIEAIAEASKLRIENESARRLSLLAKQVSHDIRSPLVVLKMLVPKLNASDEGERRLVERAIGRVEEIANALLKKDRSAAPSGEAAGRESLSRILDEIVDEKRFEFSGRSISLTIQKQIADSLFAGVNPSDFKRVVSNLINNSVEAMPPEGGAIQVHAMQDKGRIFVRVEDTGKGIPREILSCLGEEGFSYGKVGSQGGNGLGLHHAREFAETSSGRLSLESEVGVGTRVTLELPASIQWDGG